MKTSNEKHFKRLFEISEWNVKQNKLYDNKDEFRIAESITSLGNEFMGTRGNHEELYSGDHHQGSYIGGVWFPDKTRVGWWKNGYPKYFGKQINSINWLPIRVWIDNKEIDLNKYKPISYTKDLDMKNGILYRSFVCKIKNIEVTVKTERFISIDQKNLAAINYSVSVNKDCEIIMKPYIDNDVINLDSNYNESFWDIEERCTGKDFSFITSITKKNPFNVPRFFVSCIQALDYKFKANEKEFKQDNKVGRIITINAKKDTEYVLTKKIYISNSRHTKKELVHDSNLEVYRRNKKISYEELKKAHSDKWNKRWELADIKIEGDISSQQAIRFNLFQLFNTFYGEDNTLNIGPKGFTGEKYGGATYWDTEAYCFPVYLASSDKKVAKSLLEYRYKQLEQAKHNAKQQGLDGALYPMVTFDGIECHNEWEITFEEIHRNGAMAHAIYSYYVYTDDDSYIKTKGLEVLIEISKFWADRVHWSEKNKKYMIHGVTGPNEFENNINNNFYTNYLARWTIQYTLEIYNKFKSKFKLDKKTIDKWKDIVEKMYLPEDKKNKIFVQHDTFLDKDIRPVSSLDSSERPIVHNWSWDKILRSCFIKQADTLQTFYFFPHHFDKKIKKSNFDFYEPLTVHESSLSPSVHSIIAAEIGYEQKAVDMYLRSARLDLDNINDDTKDGLHITSLAGSWLSIIQGFSGMRFLESKLEFSPFIPKQWKSYSYKLNYKKSLIQIEVNKKDCVFTHLRGGEVDFYYKNKKYSLSSKKQLTIKI